QLAARFNPEHIAIAISASVHETELSVRDILYRWRHRADFHLPSMPSRDQLQAEARHMFAKTRHLDDIVDRAHELLVEAGGLLLLVRRLASGANPALQLSSGVAVRHPRTE